MAMMARYCRDHFSLFFTARTRNLLEEYTKHIFTTTTTYSYLCPRQRRHILINPSTPTTSVSRKIPHIEFLVVDPRNIISLTLLDRKSRAALADLREDVEYFFRL
mgnify:CR=1 FL=1